MIMNQIFTLFQHPVSALVAIGVLSLLVRLGPRLFQRKSPGDSQVIASSSWTAYFMTFFSGVLFTNALAHFSHGISAEQFPAPFGYALVSGFPEYLSNVLWGFLNLVLGYSLLVKSKVFDRDLLGKIAFFTGILAMGIFLSYVFSH